MDLCRGDGRQAYVSRTLPAERGQCRLGKQAEARQDQRTNCRCRHCGQQWPAIEQGIWRANCCGIPHSRRRIHVSDRFANVLAAVAMVVISVSLIAIWYFWEFS